MNVANAATTRALPGVIRSGINSIGFELRGYFRAPDSVFFTFLFPVVMLAIFGTAFASTGEVGTLPDGTGGVDMASYYLPGMISAGILLSGFQNLAIDIALEKHDGWLRRLGGSPLSPVSYFIGKFGTILVTSVLQIALVILFAVVVFQVKLPTEPSAWLTFAWLATLGIATMTMLGVAISALPRSGKSATAVILPIALLLQFVSGVYLMFDMLPEWLQQAASVFPLKWLAQGMRGVFLPEHFAELEPSGAWDFGLIAINLAVWLVIGLIASLLTFRWVRRS